MFWTKRKSLSENIDVIMQAKEQAAIKNQREALMAIEKAMHERAYNAPVSINLAAMKAFSIERLVKNGKVCTIIGYFLNNDVEVINMQIKLWRSIN